MASVFSGSLQKVGGIIKAEHVKLGGTGFAGPAVGAGAGVPSATGAVVQQLQISFERSMNMLYEIGSPDVYYVGDRRRGTIQASRVVAGAQDFKNMIGNYGDLCKAHTNTMTISAGIATGTCGPANNSTVEYKCNGVVLVNLGASVTAQEIVVTESVGFQFVELEYK